MQPSMSRVIAMLTGDVEEIPAASCPGYITDWQYNNHLAAQDPGSTSIALSPQQKSTEILLPAALSLPENEDMTPSVVNQALEDEQ